MKIKITQSLQIITHDYFTNNAHYKSIQLFLLSFPTPFSCNLSFCFLSLFFFLFLKFSQFITLALRKLALSQYHLRNWGEKRWAQFAYRTASTTHVTHVFPWGLPTWTSTSGRNRMLSLWGQEVATERRVLIYCTVTLGWWTASPAGKCTSEATRFLGKKRTSSRKPTSVLVGQRWRRRKNMGARQSLMRLRKPSAWFGVRLRRSRVLLCLGFSEGSCPVPLV